MKTPVLMAWLVTFVVAAASGGLVQSSPAAPAGRMETAQYDQWVSNWYQTKSNEPFVALLRKGSALVIEDAEGVDVGSIGSNNIMVWKMKGCVGVVTSATARDTDEIIAEKVPLYFKQVGRGIRPGRNEIESVNQAIVGGRDRHARRCHRGRRLGQVSPTHPTTGGARAGQITFPSRPGWPGAVRDRWRCW